MGQLRIIAGNYRGKKIAVPDLTINVANRANDTANKSISLRPTSARARTTLFNWLKHFGAINSDTCALDLFCGSGILGIEAMSRGIDRITFVDSHLPLIQALQAQITKLNTGVLPPAVKATTATIINQDALLFCSDSYRKAKTWDLIFCDPPYARTDYQKILTRLRPMVATNGLLYIESNYHLESLIAKADFNVLRAKKIANSWLHLLLPN